MVSHCYATGSYAIARLFYVAAVLVARTRLLVARTELITACWSRGHSSPVLLSLIITLLDVKSCVSQRRHWSLRLRGLLGHNEAVLAAMTVSRFRQAVRLFVQVENSGQTLVIRYRLAGIWPVRSGVAVML